MSDMESPQDHHRNPTTTFLVAYPINPALSLHTNSGSTLYWITLDNKAATHVRIVPNAYDRSATIKFSYMQYILGDVCCGVFCAATDTSAILWNPSTREEMLVEFDICASGPGLTSFNTTTKYIGFGCVKDAEGVVIDFKLLIMLITRGRRTFQLYSLKAGSWTSVCRPTFSISDISLNGGIYLDGVIHWLAQAGRKAYILTFDLVRGNFGQIHLPDDICQIIDIKDTNKYFISVFDNQYIQFGMVDHSESLYLWIRDETKSWVRREHIVLGQLMKNILMLRYFDSHGGVITQADVEGNFWVNIEGNASKHNIGVYGRSKWYQYEESNNVSLQGIASIYKDIIGSSNIIQTIFSEE